MMKALADNGTVIAIFGFERGTQCVTFCVEYKTNTSVVIQLLDDGCYTAVCRDEKSTTMRLFLKG